MLFDLRGRGRRRTVQIIYLGLALLMGVGLVGFGVGGGLGGGGIFDAVNGNAGSSGATFDSKIKKDRKVVAAQPNNRQAWADLIHDLYAQAGTGENYVTTATASGFTPKAHNLLTQTDQAWARYLALNPKHPSSSLASLMIQVYAAPGALDQPAKAVKVMKIVIADRPPNAGLYASLANYAYLAHQVPLGDRSAKKALALTPKADRTILQNQLAQAKKAPTDGGKAPTTAAGSANPNALTGTVKTPNGQTLTITGATTTPAGGATSTTTTPAGTTPAKKK
ncbi:MAG TPA: hypothetical protein VLJ42_06785 [Solirubrobacteraceae bacterium]|nr:hypothetical protein [Solirubrobacteraceae bacterium]